MAGPRSSRPGSTVILLAFAVSARQR